MTYELLRVMCDYDSNQIDGESSEELDWSWTNSKFSLHVLIKVIFSSFDDILGNILLLSIKLFANIQQFLFLRFPVFVLHPIVELFHEELVNPFDCIGLHDTEENAYVDKMNLEVRDEQMINISLEHEGQDAVEEEVCDNTSEQGQETERIVSVKPDSKFEVGNENADTIHGHASDPESYVFTVRLHSAWLAQAVQNNEEYNDCMPQRIEDPLHEKFHREAFPIYANLK